MAGKTDSNWVTTASPVTVALPQVAAGAAYCINCHSAGGFASDKETPYLASRHSNSNGLPKASTSSCAACHNPEGEAAVGAAAVIGCEGCHGTDGAGGHPDAINTPSQALAVCAGCHDGHSTNIVATVTASNHGDLGHNDAAKCQRCHTLEGSLDPTIGGTYTGDATVMQLIEDNAVAAIPPANTSAPTCAACHDSHSGAMRAVPGWDPNNNATADQFDLCTSCHTLVNPDGTLVASGLNGTAPFYHDTAWFRGIASTHFDDPNTATIEGYNVDITDENPCFACHGHNLTANTRPGRAATVFTDWAQSAHAGGLMTVKYEKDAELALIQHPTELDHSGNPAMMNRTAEGFAEIMTVGVTDATGPAWSHYDWDAADRQSCQRCHTATGAKNFLSDPVNYDPAANDFSHLVAAVADDPGTGVDETVPGQNELLYCYACHTVAGTGELRNPGAITENYTGETVNYPDVGNSNICMGCHLGRDTGASIQASTADFSNASFINSHYLAAGGMVFAESGYEYAGQDYSKHFGGHSGAGSADGRGPCVTCHMTSDNQHQFSVVEKDGNGVVTAVTSQSCNSCHGDMNAVWLEERAETFHAALENLKLALDSAGVYFLPSYPYFFNTPAGGFANALKDWTLGGTMVGKDVMGAAFNYNLLEHDPGAYAHNRVYALKLIADSIDYITDGALDGSGVINAGLPEEQDLLTPVQTALGYTLDAKHFTGEALVQAEYTVDTSAYNVGCGDCHASGSKTSNPGIIDGFAESGHGDVFGEAWMHYDWRQDSRAACQRCHTATGYVAKLGNEADTTNVFDGESGTSLDLNLPGETLRCTGCHVDIATGALRTPGAFTASFSNAATFAYGDLSASNICVRCHSGRESGESIVNEAGDFTNLSFINSHYLTAGATVFAATGYEYAGGSSAGDFGQHQLIGMGDVFGTGNSGPCVGCHMSSGEGHSWEFVTKDDLGNITANTSTVCANCHAGMDGATMQTLKDGFHTALVELKSALEAKGIYFLPNYPYFFNNPAGGFANALKDWTLGGTMDGKMTMGAAFNYNLLEHDPGAYAHNRGYALALIADSIDFLSDGVVDGVGIPVTVSNLQAAVQADGHGEPVFAPEPTVGNINTCGECHVSTAAVVAASKHNAGGHNSSAKCDRCHTAEGIIQLGDTYTGDKTVMDQIGTDGIANIDPDQPPTCIACHEDSTGAMRAVAGWDPNGSGTADEFDLCTACHVYYNQDGLVTASGNNGTAPFYHNTSWWRTIATTHYDDPATSYENSNAKVEGYVIRSNSANPCFDCHGHELTTNTGNVGRQYDPDGGYAYVEQTPAPTIHTDWAKSAHAGNLLEAKYAAQDAYPRISRFDDLGNLITDQAYDPSVGMTDAVMAAGADGETVSWPHYNWDDTASRGACQMCHTATGAANFMTDPANYDQVNNDFSHLAAGQNEVLYCWGCHTDAGTGALRTPGAITLAYTADGANPTLPDLGNSNVCVNCHAGRGNADSLLSGAALDPNAAQTSGRATATHYLGAAQTIFQSTTKVGYMYPGQNYADEAFFAHDGVGCVDCHMATANSHSYEVVAKDELGAITAINSQATCDACHSGGFAIDAAILEHEAEGFHEALEVLNQALIAKGITFTPNYPYFTFTTIPGVNDNGDWINQGNFGAAHNYNYLHHEPGAYAHNRFFAKRLIFDSIDWVDNGAIDGSITIDANTYPKAAEWYGAPAPASGPYAAARP